MNLCTCTRQFFDQYLIRLKGCSEQTIASYREVFTLFLSFSAGYYKIKIPSLTLDHLSVDLILDFLDYLELKRSNTSRTRNQRLAALKSFAKMIRLLHPEKRKIAESIIYLPQKKPRKHLVGFLYIEEIMACYKAVDLREPVGFRNYTILHLLSDSGARANELATLQLDDYNPYQQTLGILGKGNKFRLIELEQKTTGLINRYIHHYRIRPKPIYMNRLFINKYGNGLTRHGIYRICSKYLSKVLSPKRFKNISPVHSFRHSCAVNMLACGKSLTDVMNRLGHKNLESTMIYLQMDLANKRKVQKKYLAYLQSTLKHDPKIYDLVGWDDKNDILAWLDSL